MSLRFGIIGIGNFGKHYVRLLNGAEGAELIAVASRSPERFKLFENILPENIIKTIDATALINNAEVDCVVIATPSSTHFSLARQALAAGKHVLVEKPMVTTLAEAIELKKTVENSKNTFMVGHQYVYNDYIRFLKRYIDTGALGKIKNISAEHASSTMRTDIGCFMDVAPHQLSIINYMLGVSGTISAEAKGTFKNGLDYAANVKIKFESGLTASLSAACIAPKKIRKFTIVGENGSAVFDDTAENNKLKIFLRGEAPAIPIIDAKEPLQNQLNHFISCIKTGKTPLTGIESSYQVSEWLDKIQNILIRTA